MNSLIDLDDTKLVLALRFQRSMHEGIEGKKRAVEIMNELANCKYEEVGGRKGGGWRSLSSSGSTDSESDSNDSALVIEGALTRKSKLLRSDLLDLVASLPSTRYYYNLRSINIQNLQQD